MMTWRARADGRLRALRALPELSRLSGSDLRGLLVHFDEVTVPAGTVVARAGRYCAQFVVVLDGRLETRSEPGSPEATAGASCGWDEMCERGVNRATVLAGSDARLLVMGRAQFRAVPEKARGRGQGSGARRPAPATTPRAAAAATCTRGSAAVTPGWERPTPR